MSTPVFPTLAGITFPSLKRSEFNTIRQDSPNMMDTRVSQTRNPFWHWEAVIDFIDDKTPVAGFTEAETLRGFQLTLGGSAGDFFYTDPTDNSVGPAVILGVPNARAQLQVVTDGAGNYFSPIQRNMGGFLEDITDLNGAIAVYATALSRPAEVSITRFSALVSRSPDPRSWECTSRGPQTPPGRSPLSSASTSAADSRMTRWTSSSSPRKSGPWAARHRAWGLSLYASAARALHRCSR
jgi:hypothetical protein